MEMEVRSRKWGQTGARRGALAYVPHLTPHRVRCSQLTAFKPRFGLVKMKGASYVDGQKVVEGTFQFAMVVEKK